MDAADIARIKLFHRPSIRWIGVRVILDCSCRYGMYPCPLRRAVDRAVDGAAK
jgi:hypothetical protein